MKYCIKCIQPDTRPNTQFLPNGLCPACNYFIESRNIDWEERNQILLDILDKNQSKAHRNFDCIIGVSGGKDSLRQALFVRDKLNLKPLLVSLNFPPQEINDRGAFNVSNMIENGFDVLISSPAPETWRKLTRAGFLKFTNYARSIELALFASVPKIAITHKIPLIFWGENPGLQLGDLKTLGKTGYDGNNLRYQNTLSDASHDIPDWIFDSADTINNLNVYKYPSLKLFDENDIQIIYLGWFWKDWSLVNNASYSIANGLKIRNDTVENTGDLMGVTALDDDWVTLNQMIKYYKYGFGRVTDYCNEEIRLERMSRDKAIELAEKYDDSCSEKYIIDFCNFIKITKEKFWEVVHKNINEDLFELTHDKKIVKKFEIGYGF